MRAILNRKLHHALRNHSRYFLDQNACEFCEMVQGVMDISARNMSMTLKGGVWEFACSDMSVYVNDDCVAWELDSDDELASEYAILKIMADMGRLPNKSVQARLAELGD